MEDVAEWGSQEEEINNGFSLNLGSHLFLVKAHNENCCVHLLTNTLKQTEHHYLSQYSFAHSSCLDSIFIIYQNFVFLITRLIEVNVDYQEERKSLKTNIQNATFLSLPLLINAFPFSLKPIILI